MNKHFIRAAVTALGLIAASAFAVDDAGKPHNDMPPPPVGHGKEWTLEEARKHAHENADRLDKMTEEEWKHHQEKRREFMDKWDKMTPEEKEEARKKRAEKRQEHKDGNPPADAPSPAAGK